DAQTGSTASQGSMPAATKLAAIFDMENVGSKYGIQGGSSGPQGSMPPVSAQSAPIFDIGNVGSKYGNLDATSTDAGRAQVATVGAGILAVSAGEKLLTDIFLVSHYGAVASAAVAASFAGGYAVGWTINEACDNCFGTLGAHVYDITHPESVPSSQMPQMPKISPNADPNGNVPMYWGVD
ncbi:MAG TPA: hypothetical protein VF943_06440, partial [Burkholderiales bacterium]